MGFAALRPARLDDRCFEHVMLARIQLQSIRYRERTVASAIESPIQPKETLFRL